MNKFEILETRILSTKDNEELKELNKMVEYETKKLVYNYNRDMNSLIDLRLQILNKLKSI